MKKEDLKNECREFIMSGSREPSDYLFDTTVFCYCSGRSPKTSIKVVYDIVMELREELNPFRLSENDETAERTVDGAGTVDMTADGVVLNDYDFDENFDEEDCVNDFANIEDLKQYVDYEVGYRLKNLIGNVLDYDEINECFVFDYSDYGFDGISNTVVFENENSIPFSSARSFAVYDGLVRFVIDISVDIKEDGEVVKTIIDVY